MAKTAAHEFPLNFTGTNIEFTDSLRAYAAKKLRKLLKHFHPINSVDIEHTVQRNWHSIEVTVHGDGLLLRGEERASEVQGALDKVLDKVESQFHRYYGKLTDLRRRPAGEIPAAVAEEAGAEEEAEIAEPDPLSAGGGPQIVRMKRFELKPMTPEEAAMQMDLLGHGFFVFTNADTEQVNVIYRRNDGNYGLIEPEG
jgi:putative sigma-54 modulation protein